MPIKNLKNGKLKKKNINHLLVIEDKNLEVLL